MSKKIRSPNSIESYRIYSETFSTCVLAESQLHLIGNFAIFPSFVIAKIQLHLIERILRHFPIVSQPEFNCILSNIFYHFPQLCPGQNSFEFFAKTSRTIPKCCSAKIQLHLIKIIPGYVQKDS